ncbi:MAG: regulatory protein RecX [Bacillota bacterium]
MRKKTGNTPMDAALDFLAPKQRTVLETELYLDEQNYGEFEVYQVIERLKELGLLDDARYAGEFIRSRLATKPVSRRKLRDQLLEHRIDRDAIESALLAVTDEIEQNNANQIAEKFNRQLSSLEDEERRERVLRRLSSRGFEYETAQRAWENVYAQQ